MIKFEHTEVVGWEPALRGMRNPLNSWDKADSFFERFGDPIPYYKGGIKTICDGILQYSIGPNDYDLMKRLRNAGTDHRKWMRMINVYVDITAGHTWWAEFDTYKIATVRNSCSKMHRIHIKEFIKDDFDHEGIDEVGGSTVEIFEGLLNELERLRVLFNETKEKKYWRAIIELLPLGYHLKATVMLNYETLANIYKSRQNHKMFEWHDFCTWIESLPYSEFITGEFKE